MASSKFSAKLKNFFNRQIRPSWFVISAALVAGIILGSLVTAYHLDLNEQKLWDQIHPVRLHSNYTFTNPLLTYSIPDNSEISQFKPLQTKVQNFINSQTQNNKITDASVYFRDMNLGRWMGINENAKYSPASMMKVPLMMAFYKEAETDPSVLSKEVTYTKAINDTIAEVPFQASSTLEIGKSYTIEQLIENMIISSDNGAKNALLANIDPDSFNEIFTDLGIETPDGNDTDYLISAKVYSQFFRTLYNSTFLSDAMSEKALEVLNRAEYKDGLAAGIPQDVKIAQKFGEHVDADPTGQQTGLELHDCGIIYQPSHPYVLCVMTKGANLDDLTATIKNISALVYQSVNSNYKE